MLEETDKVKLIFVYNADSGVFNLVTDIAHKIFSPQTYTCQLCALTHSNFGMRKEWKEYLASLDAELEFLHADEFKRKYPLEKADLPAVFKAENEILKLLADARAINQCRSLEDLQKLLKL